MANELVTQTFTTVRGGDPKIVVVQLHVLCDDADGDIEDTDFSSEVMNVIMGMELIKVQTVPDGVTGPTDNTDFTIDDANGIDMLGGAGANMIDNAASNEFGPLSNSENVTQLVTSQWTLTQASEQAVNSAEYDIYLYFVKPNGMK